MAREGTGGLPVFGARAGYKALPPDVAPASPPPRVRRVSAAYCVPSECAACGVRRDMALVPAAPRGASVPESGYGQTANTGLPRAPPPPLLGSVRRLSGHGLCDAVTRVLTWANVRRSCAVTPNWRAALDGAPPDRGLSKCPPSKSVGIVVLDRSLRFWNSETFHLADGLRRV